MPILVRPVREQLEHDRVIRLLQDKWKKKFDVEANVGDERRASVKLGQMTIFPDLTLYTSSSPKRLQAVIEVETGESLNHLEAMAQWTHMSKLKAPFQLFVPVNGIDQARRLCDEHQVTVSELWSYYVIGDQVRFTLVKRVGPALVDGKGNKQSAQPAEGELFTETLGPLELPPRVFPEDEEEPPPPPVAKAAPAKTPPAAAKAAPAPKPSPVIAKAAATGKPSAAQAKASAAPAQAGSLAAKGAAPAKTGGTQSKSAAGPPAPPAKPTAQAAKASVQAAKSAPPAAKPSTVTAKPVPVPAKPAALAAKSAAPPAQKPARVDSGTVKAAAAKKPAAQVPPKVRTTAKRVAAKPQAPRKGSAIPVRSSAARSPRVAKPAPRGKSSSKTSGRTVKNSRGR